MIEKILPKRYATHNCIENCIANLCDSADINFFPLFLFSWDFGYDTSQSTIGERIHHHNSCDIGLENYFYISEKYFNIHFSPIPNGSKITDELVNRESCLLIGIDSFECPWNLAYQKYHYPHFYILKSREIYGYCAIDSFCCSDLINVDIDTLCKSERVYTVNFHNSNNPPKKRLLLKEFCERLKNNVEIEIFETIKKFGFDLTQINSINDLASNLPDVSNDHLTRRMNYIFNMRKNTLSLLEFLNYPTDIICGFKEIVDKWESLKNLFIKILISKRLYFLKQARETLVDIAETEDRLCSEIINYGMQVL